MATVQTVIDRVYRALLAGLSEGANSLASGVDASATSLTLTYDLESIQERTVIEIGTEQMFVWARDTTAKTATVARGWNGTTAASHSSADVVRANPRFPHSEIFDAVADEVDDLSSPDNGLFQVTAVELTSQATKDTYDLTSATAVKELLEVRLDTSDPTDRWPDITRHTTLLRNANTTDFASGFAVKFDRYLQPGRTIRVLYAGPFTRPTATSNDLQSDVGLTATMNDILYLGTSARMLSLREGKRSFIESQGDSQRFDEVGQGGMIRSASALLFERDRRIAAEASRLRQQYPYRKTS